jgi:ATP-dependent RNA helicase DDX5/DBP2
MSVAHRRLYTHPFQEHPAVAAMTPQEADQWRRDKQITVQGANVPKPVRTFEEGSFPDYILNVVEKEYGLQARPTPIQSQVRGATHGLACAAL